MKQTFYIDLYGACALVNASTQESAEKWAAYYFGAHVKSVELATKESVTYVTETMHGEIYEAA